LFIKLDVSAEVKSGTARSAGSAGSPHELNAGLPSSKSGGGQRRQTRDLNLNAGCVGFLNDVDVVMKSHSNFLSARTPEKMINDRLASGLIASLVE